MKGLLHRVAARAAGTAALVRPDTGPVYGGGFGTADAFGAELPGLAAPAPSYEPAAVAAREGVRESMPPRTLPGTAFAAGPAVSIDAAEVAAAHAPTEVTARATAPLGAPAVLVQSPSGESARLPRQGSAAQPAAPVPVAEGEPAAAALQAPQVPPPQTVTIVRRGSDAAKLEEARPAAQHPVRGDTPLPAPLMAPQPRPASAAATAFPRPQAATPAAAQAAAHGGADTEVHIHIGRIDVTAVQEGPAARHRGPPGPAPLSLDAYLAKRERR